MNSRESFCTPAMLSTATRLARENRADLRERLLTGSDDGEAARLGRGHPVGGDARDPAGAQVAEREGLDHCDERAVGRIPQQKQRAGAAFGVHPALRANEIVELA